MDNDMKKLYNLLVKLEKKVSDKKDNEGKELLDKVLKNQKGIDDRLRRIENKLRKL